MENVCKSLFAAVMANAVAMTAFAQVVTPVPRMDRTRLNIGTYCLKPYGRTEAHIKDIADCGMDFVIESLDRDFAGDCPR